MKFEWDATKAEINRYKHGVSFQNAAAVFSDPKALFREDPAHSEVEARRLVMGRARGWLLVVAFTVRGDRVRLISARRASRQERRSYAQIQK